MIKDLPTLEELSEITGQTVKQLRKDRNAHHKLSQSDNNMEDN